MLTPQEIEQRFAHHDEIHYIKVAGDGYKYQITLVSDLFLKQSKVARQQWVYKQVNDLITSGKLHALTINAWTKEEWEAQHG